MTGNWHRCVATNPFGTVTSSYGTLTVGSGTAAAPAITVQPVTLSLVDATSGSGTMSVTATGTPAPTYVWYRAGVGAVSIWSGTGPKTFPYSSGNSLVFDMSVAHGGYPATSTFYVVATNATGAATSSTVTFSLQPAATNVTNLDVPLATINYVAGLVDAQAAKSGQQRGTTLNFEGGTYNASASTAMPAPMLGTAPATVLQNITAPNAYGILYYTGRGWTPAALAGTVKMKIWLDGVFLSTSDIGTGSRYSTCYISVGGTGVTSQGFIISSNTSAFHPASAWQSFNPIIFDMPTSIPADLYVQIQISGNSGMGTDFRNSITITNIYVEEV